MLTPKQEGFCQSFIETGNASEAYRRHYDASKMRPESINRAAKELLDNPKITSRIDVLREEVLEEHRLTVYDIIRELEEARQVALNCETPQSSAAVGASMGKARILGFDKQTIDHKSSDGSMRPPAPVYNIVNK